MASHRILVTGASGLLGRSVFGSCQKQNQWVTSGLCFNRCSPGLIKVDITNLEEVEDIFNKIKPTVVIHCAAERRPDKVQNDNEGKTQLLNVTATGNICSQAARIGAYVIYISTDYVFDGVKPPHHVESKPNPLNVYGETKLEGEKVTQQISKDNIVLRVPVLYGPVNFKQESAVTQLFELVENHGKVHELDNYARRYPTHVKDVASVIIDIINKKSQQPENVKGIYHWSDNQNMTKYEMAMCICKVFELPHDHLIPNNNAPSGAPRPYDAHLDTTRLIQLGICHRTNFETGIKDALIQFIK